jgi:anti-sigma regulatory factor (Ser/Thr protein kinase)
MPEPDAAPDLLCITNALNDLAKLYPWFEAAGARHRLSPKLIQEMHVALEEAVMNVATHAYSPNSAEPIVVRLAVDEHRAQLCIEDVGPPFNPLKAPEILKSSNLADLMPGGHGIRLIRHFCNDLGYARLDGRNQLSMRFVRNA